MKNRNGEKIGWTVGWTGSFVFLLLIANLWFLQGEKHQGMVTLGFFVFAIVSVNLITPWRYPDVKYWKLFLLPYIILSFAMFNTVAYTKGLADLVLQWKNVTWLIPVMIPLILLGNRTWNDGNSS
jgi:hypothetical protein